MSRLHRDRALGRREHDGHERERRRRSRPTAWTSVRRCARSRSASLGGELGVEAGRRGVRSAGADGLGPDVVARRLDGPRPARRDPRPPDPRAPWRARWRGSPTRPHTPGVRVRKRSMRLTHEAQVMPSMGRTISMGVGRARCRAVVILPGSIPARVQAMDRTARHGPEQLVETSVAARGARSGSRPARTGSSPSEQLGPREGFAARPGAARLRAADPLAAAAGRRRGASSRRGPGTPFEALLEGEPLGARRPARSTSTTGPRGTGWCSRRSGRSRAARPRATARSRG